MNKRVPIGIWPTVCVQRPHTGSWHEVIRELGTLEEWVRTIAIPILITGRRDQAPLPPRLDITTGFDDFPRALAAAGQKTAAKQAARRVQAAVARQEIVDVLAEHPSFDNRPAVEAWVAGLDDERLLGHLERLITASGRRDLRAVDAAARALLKQALRVVDEA